MKSLEISDNATINVQSGSSTSCIVGAPSNSSSIGFRLDYRPWHTYESKYSCVCIHVCWYKYKCVFQFSQNPVHGMPSSMTEITDNDHQAPKLKQRRAFTLMKNKLDKQFPMCMDLFRIQTFLITLL